PLRVPLGIGPNYLARIKGGGEEAAPKFRPSAKPFVRVTNTPAVARKPMRLSWWIAGCGVAGILAAVLVSVRESGSVALSRSQAENSGAVTAPAERKRPSAPPTAATGAVVAPKSGSEILVERLNVTGFFGGARPKALINGELKAAGDL